MLQGMILLCMTLVLIGAYLVNILFTVQKAVESQNEILRRLIQMYTAEELLKVGIIIKD